MLIVINGPIGAGKSTVAVLLGELFEADGRSVAAIDLDERYLEMAGKPMDDPDVWMRARHSAAEQVDSSFAAGVEVVIVEGPFRDKAERDAFLEHVSWPGEPRFVTLLVSHEEALRRVRGDETRGVSRDPEFLRRELAEFDARWGAMPHSDLVLDTVALPAELVAAQIVESLGEPN